MPTYRQGLWVCPASGFSRLPEGGIVAKEDSDRPRYGWDKDSGEELDDEGTSLLKVIQWLLEEVPDLEMFGGITVEWSECGSDQIYLEVKDGKLFQNVGQIEFKNPTEVKLNA